MTTPSKENVSGSASATTRSGFTLIELLIVVLIISLMAAIAVPNIDRVDFQVKAAANETVTAISAAKHMAVLKQHDVVLAFDVTNRRIRVHSDRNSNDNMDAGEDVRFFELPDDIDFGKGGAPAVAGVTAVHNLTQSQVGLPSLTFHRNGSASQEARFYITSRRGAQSGGFPDDARTFTVARATGMVACRTYTTASSWRRGC